MKKIAFIGDAVIRDRIGDVVANAAESINAKTIRLDTPKFNESVIRSLWEAIKSSDVVVADVSSGSSNVIYEVGLAHGMGKPVLLLTSTGAKPLPADLSGQLYIQFADTLEGIRNLEYRLAHLFREHFESNKKIPRLYGPSEAISVQRGPNNIQVSDFESLLSESGFARHQAFSDWFARLLKAIPFWEVISRPDNIHDRGYDLVIWNDSSDTEFAALGNPIPIELIAHKILRPDTVAAACQRAQLERLKGIIIATTAKSTVTTRKLIQQLYEVQRFAVLLLDYQSLHDVKSSKDLLNVAGSRLRRVVYGVSEDV